MSANHVKSVETRLRYLQWQPLYETEKPYQVFAPLTDNSIPRTNLVFEDGPFEKIYNARDRKNEFKLDIEGFCFDHAVFEDGDVQDANVVESKYLGWVKNLLRRHCGENVDVHIFDWQVCSSLILQALHRLIT